VGAEQKGVIEEFKEFVFRGNVVDLAVAVVVGAAFGAVVNGLVKDLLTPLIAAIAGKPDFSDLTFTIHKSKFLYGDLANTVVSFLSISAMVFIFVVKPINFLLDRRKRLMSNGAEPDPVSLSDEAVLLAEIRDLLRERRSSLSKPATNGLAGQLLLPHAVTSLEHYGEQNIPVYSEGSVA
jgi:large conductance mechanosensitive channel